MNRVRKIQIGVMGSSADLHYADEVEHLAELVGGEIATSGAVCIFGAEKDYDSLSTVAGRAARRAGGLTVGITYGKGLAVWDEADIVIATGLERGGGREFSLVLSCDAIITIGGGSATLTEMLVAYQANIPIIALTGSGGWSDKVAGTFLDARERVRVQAASTPREAVQMAWEAAMLRHDEEVGLKQEVWKRNDVALNVPHDANHSSMNGKNGALKVG